MQAKADRWKRDLSRTRAEWLVLAESDGQPDPLKMQGCKPVLVSERGLEPPRGYTPHQVLSLMLPVSVGVSVCRLVKQTRGFPHF